MMLRKMATRLMGVLLSVLAFKKIEHRADRIKIHIDERRTERGNERGRSQEDECLERLVDLCKRLPVDNKSNITQPQLGRMLITAVALKTLVDHGLSRKILVLLISRRT